MQFLVAKIEQNSNTQEHSAKHDGWRLIYVSELSLLETAVQELSSGSNATKAQVA